MVHTSCRYCIYRKYMCTISTAYARSVCWDFDFFKRTRTSHLEADQSDAQGEGKTDGVTRQKSSLGESPSSNTLNDWSFLDDPDVDVVP